MTNGCQQGKQGDASEYTWQAVCGVIVKITLILSMGLLARTEINLCSFLPRDSQNCLEAFVGRL